MLTAALLFLPLVVASWALVVALQLESRAEQVIACTLVASFGQSIPFYILGVTGHLRSVPVALATLGASGLLAVSAYKISGRGLFRQIVRGTHGLLQLVPDTFAVLARERSPQVLGVLACGVMFVWTAATSYLAPAWRGFDAVWYHESMIGFTLQNGSFAFVDLPPGLQKINGYPRLGEMTQAWFALFAGRRLIDLPNTLFLPSLFAGAYAVVRRSRASTSVCLGWASSVVLMPACANLFQSVYVDPQTAAYTLAIAHFVTKPTLRLREAALAWMGLTLAVGSKTLSLVPVGVLAPVLLVRLHPLARIRSLRKLAIACGVTGVVTVCAMASVTYLRNFLSFHNPFWPDLHVSLPKLGIDWPGQMVWGADRPKQEGDRVEMNEPLGQLFDHLTSLPYSIHQWHYGESHDFGFAWVWVALPLGLVGLVWSACRGVFSAAVQLRARSCVPNRDMSRLMLEALLVIIIVTSPALWAPRYHIATAALFALPAAWLAERLHSRGLAEAAPFTIVVGALMILVWAPHRWWIGWSRAMDLLATPYPAREVTEALGAPVTTQFGLARENELRPGDVVLAHDFVFPSLLWNNDYSNVVIIDNKEPLNVAVSRLHPRWAICEGGDCLRLRTLGWRDIGAVSPDRPEHAWARPAGT